ncbi:MAG: hypothetical protein V1781_08625 [Bacteroidota bacterium]
MKKIYILFFLLSVSLLFSFYEIKFSLVKSIPLTSSFFTTDNIKNTYIIRNNTIEKYDNEGNALKNYSNKNLGEITSLDASNSLKILVFYKNFLHLLFLDNTLSQNGNSISLESLGYNQVSLISSSHNNGFWLYNQQNSELVRFNQSLQITHQTGNITQLIGSEINPVFLTEQNNKVFLNDTQTGILVFDIYGTYYKTIPIKNIKHFQISNDDIFFYKNNKLNNYNMKTLEQSEMTLPDSSAIDVRIEKENLFLLKQKSLDIYTLLSD